jgi:hypothetical protein
MFINADLSCNFAKKNQNIDWGVLSSSILNKLHPSNAIWRYVALNNFTTDLEIIHCIADSKVINPLLDSNLVKCLFKKNSMRRRRSKGRVERDEDLRTRLIVSFRYFLLFGEFLMLSSGF